MDGMVMKIGLVALGGGSGALARWGLSAAVQRGAERWAAVSTPVGTLAANALGCLLIGLALSWLTHRAHWHAHLVPLLVVGFLGSFTTFSTYAFEAVQHARASDWLTVALHILAHNGVGLVLVVAGLRIGEWLARGGV